MLEVIWWIFVLLWCIIGFLFFLPIIIGLFVYLIGFIVYIFGFIVYLLLAGIIIVISIPVAIVEYFRKDEKKCGSSESSESGES